MKVVRGKVSGRNRVKRKEKKKREKNEEQEGRERNRVAQNVRGEERR
jgi:hypothetical protein